MSHDPRFDTALRQIDLANAADPNHVAVEGATHPRELLYSRRLSDWVLRLAPDASEVLLLAARSQHLCRWLIPRQSYEMSRSGYLRWRSELKKLHASKTAEILRNVGYPQDVIERVEALNLKANLGKDPECQVLEDALCLVTLQYQLDELISKTAPEKLVEILRKTWRKMSSAAHEHAKQLSFSPAAAELIGRALG